MNTISRREPLVRALLDPAGTLTLDLSQWNDLLLAGREQGLLARLGAQLAGRGLFNAVPDKARAHIRAACIGAESSQTAVRFEINRVLRALDGLDTPIVLLKGAAYVMAGLPPAPGRLVGDLDLIVPREKIDIVEQTLVAKGWTPAELDDYDQRYYREWMHEIPPLQYPERETPVDIHHTIVPLTSRTHPDAAALLAESEPLADPRLRVLAPADMVLHAAVHLFNDEVGKPLRDLFDLHDLLCHFGARPGFWDQLQRRARLHGLGRPLCYMIRHTRKMIGTQIPPDFERAIAMYAPTVLLNALMDRLFNALFLPERAATAGAGTKFARWLLYLRSHWLRMPMPMLVRHLAIKAAMRARKRFERKTDSAEG